MPPHVQIILGDHAVPPSLREAVQRTGASASFRPLSEALQGSLSPTTDAVVVVVPEDTRELTRSLRVLFDRIADRPRATLLLKASGGLVPRLAHPQTVPVMFGCGLDASELTTRLATMLEMRGPLDSLHREMEACRASEEDAAQRYMNQLRLASQIQRGFMPETLPAIGPFRFSTVFRPVDYVSGDIYDVHRLDEDHIAVALADATGHGMPAALLAVFIKRALRGKEIESGHYRILRPDEVLARLNDEILDADLAECPFVAAAYAALNIHTLELSLARGGSPYPILRRKGGTLELLRPTGGVVGVLPETEFAVQTVQLEPGDALLMCSDGLERVIVPQLHTHGLAEVFARAAEIARRQNSPEPEFATALSAHNHDAAPATTLAASASAIPDTHPTGVPDNPPPDGNGSGRRHNGNGPGSGPRRSCHLPDAGPTGSRPPGLRPDEAVLTSSWSQTLRDAGVDAALHQLTVRYETLRRMGYPLDDLTVVAVQVES